MRRDFGADGMKPFVAVGVIEMPVRIDQVFDWIATETAESFGYSRTRSSDSGIDQKFSVTAGEHGDISARTLENADVPAKFLNIDLGGGRRVANGGDGTFSVGEQPARH